MNQLLRKLKQDGVMQCDCIAFSDPAVANAVPDGKRAIFHMGEGVRPGPFWAVHAEDVASLKAAGYKLIKDATS